MIIFILVLICTLSLQFTRAINVEFGYRFIETKMDYNSAFNYCKKLNMQLVTINDEPKNTRVYELAVKYKLGQYWIDGNDKENEGKWVNSKKNSLQFTKWYMREPKGGRSKNCITGLFYLFGYWNNVECSDSYAFICEEIRYNVEFGYHLNKEGMNYYSAVNYCRSQNMEMVVISDATINKRVLDIAVKYNLGQYWINGNDNVKEGSWVDSRNKPLQYKNWKSGEPNGQRKENCIHGLFYPNGLWNDISCSLSYAVICEKKRYNVEFGYHLYEEKMNYNSAVNYCKKQNMEMVVIRDATINKRVLDIAVKYNLGQYWINGNDNVKEGSWVDSRNNPLQYKNWKSGEPNGKRKENCIHGLFYPNGLWNDIPCSLSYAVICEQKRYNVEFGYHLNEEKMNYNSAVDYCKKQNMEMVLISDATINKRVLDIAVKYNLGQYWINGNDNVKEGSWVDSRNKPLQYKNWKSGEPNGQRKENCIHGLFYPNGLWNDIPCSLSYAVICEKKTNNVEFGYHLNEEKMNYNSAVNYCKKQNMEMVIINDATINKRVLDIAVKYNLGQYWINGNDNVKEGSWVDSRNKPLQYKNWKSGEPNGQRKENCIHGLFYPNGLWNDISCSLSYAVICEKTRYNVEFGYHLNKEKMNYNSAVDYCKKQNMEMVLISDATINKLVLDIAVKYNLGQYWINGNDNVKEGSWVDSSNKPLQYKNWKSGEPNGKRKENCIHGLRYPNGLWNDIPCSLSYAVICEKKRYSVEFGYHLNEEKMDYNSAVDYCKKQNMEMVIINDATINKRVLDIAVKYNLGKYWINGNDNVKEGSWVDSRNNPLQYKDWGFREPNGYRSENCIHGLSSQYGFWNDVSCSSSYAVICEKKIHNVEFGYHLNKERMNYDSAINYCKRQNLEMVLISDATINERVLDIAIKYNLGQYWINGNDNVKEGSWVDSSNNPLQYKNWKSGEPNGQRKENCIHGLFYPNGLWNDISCSLSYAVICEKTIKSVEFGYHLNKERMNYNSAVDYCKKQNMEIVTINDETINARVLDIAVKYNLGQYWINGNDNINEGKWVDSRNNLLKYKKWYRGEPNGKRTENCIHGLFYPYGYWNDIPCNHLNSVICMKSPIITADYGYVVNLQKMKYNVAVQFCKKQNMELLTIPNGIVNKRVFDMAIKYRIGYYWIDGNDVANEGNWVDSKLNQIQYTNWKSGEPNGNRRENCIHGLFYSNSLWNDISCNTPNAVICQKTKRKSQFVEYGYFINEESMNYDAAVKFCEKKNLRLLTIKNEKINKIVFNIAIYYNLGTYWITGNDNFKEGNWVDSRNISLQFKKWFKGEPNGSRKENCIHGLYFDNEFWSDVSCYGKNAVICEPLERSPADPKICKSFQELCYNSEIKKLCQITCKLWQPTTTKRIPVTTSKSLDNISDKEFYDKYCSVRYLANLFQKICKWMEQEITTVSPVTHKIKDTVELGYHYTKEKMTFKVAAKYCRARSMDLVTIDNEATNKLVHDLTLQYNIDWYWINGNDLVNERNWVDSNDNKLSYTNWYFGEPDGGKRENCIISLVYTDGFWNDVECDLPNSVICEPMRHTKNKYHIGRERMNFSEAVNYCKKRNMDLIKIDSKSTDKLVTQLAKQFLKFDYWINGNDNSKEGIWLNTDNEEIPYKNWHPEEPQGYRTENCIQGLRKNGLWQDVTCNSLGDVICQPIQNKKSSSSISLFYSSAEKMNNLAAREFCANRNMRIIKIDNASKNDLAMNYAIKSNLSYFWIDGTDSVKEGSWIDYQNQKLSYKNWYSMKPDGGKIENCIISLIDANGLWDDAHCQSMNSVICEPINDMKSGLHVTSVKMKFDTAVAYCRNKKMELVKIDDDQMNNLVFNLSLTFNLGRYWINGNDNRKEGQWEDSKLNHLSFKKWHESEPKGGRNENCITGNNYKDALWNDEKCESLNSVICQPIKYGPSKYHTSKSKLNYKDGVNYCKSKKMSLVKITDDKHNKFIYDLAIKNKLGMFWINGNDISNEGHWIDTDNNALSYLNWNIRQPNGGRKENCIQGLYYSDGTWNDVKCNIKCKVICELKVENL